MTVPTLPDWLRRRLPIASRHLEVDGLRLHLLDGGRGVPVVFLHGNPTWSYLWRQVIARLDPTRFRCIAPDLVGLGFSDRPSSDDAHTLEAHIGWMAGLLDALQLEAPIFVGQDWGGPIGLGALDTLGLRPRGLVLCNTVIGPPRPGFKGTWFHRFARVPGLSELCFRGLGFPQVALGLAQGDRRRLWFDPAYLYPLRDPRHNGAPLRLARMVPDSLEHPSVAALERTEAFVKAYDGPIRLVWGTRDPILGRVVNHLERALPEAVVTRTRGGHFLPEEEAEAIAGAIEALGA